MLRAGLLTGMMMALMGCATLPLANVTLVRLRNACPFALEHVRVNFGAGPVAYGTIAPGGTSAHQRVATAYRYAQIVAFVNGQQIDFQPQDYMGELPLGPGRFTYHVTVNAPARTLAVSSSRDN